MYSLDQALAGGSSVMRCAPVSLTAARAPSTVCCHAASSMMPMPSGDGQMSLLISFIIHSSWLGPHAEPFARVISAASSGLSRANAQPLTTAFRNATVVSAYSSSLSSRAVSAQIASCSMAPTVSW